MTLTEFDADRRHGEQALRDSEWRFRRLVESNIIGILIVDADGRVIEANHSFLKMTGYTRNHFQGIGLRLDVMTPPEFLPQDVWAREQIAAFGSCQPLEKEFLRPDGSRVSVLVGLVPLVKPENLSVCFVIDVTQKRQALEAMRKSYDEMEVHVQERTEELSHANAKLELEIERRSLAQTELKEVLKQLEGQKQALDQFAIVAETNAQGRITYVNDQFCKVSKYTAEELLGRDHRDVVNSGYHPKTFWKEMWSTIGQGRIWRGDMRNRAKDGSIYWVDTTIVPFLDASGKPWKYLAIRAVITDRKQAEAEITRSNKELEQFAYVASHDLQEPLRKINSFTEILASRYEDRLDEKAHEYFGYVKDGATRMQALIRDLLAYARAGGGEFTPQPTDLQAVAAEVVRDIQVLHQDPQEEITVGPLPTVMADPLQMKQLYQNLIGNALKFHSGEPPRVHLSAQKNETDWVFSVSDNGIGIDPQDVSHIFVIFKRLHTRTEYAGTGIGLAICEKIVSRHGGRVWVESKPGKGSTFYFTLPASSTAELLEGS